MIVLSTIEFLLNFQKALRTGVPAVEKFESKFANKCKCRNCKVEDGPWKVCVVLKGLPIKYMVIDRVTGMISVHLLLILIGCGGGIYDTTKQ
jgi:hypothetical protein